MIIESLRRCAGAVSGSIALWRCSVLCAVLVLASGASAGDDGVPPPDMVLVPAGPFTMGSASGEIDERPAHEVRLKAFYIDRTEVTAGAYQRCDAPGCALPHTGASCNASIGGHDDHPMNCVSWFQASAYCAWAGKRLPTEAEWEKAARGTDGFSYPWGEEPPTCARSVSRGCISGTAPVGSKPRGDSPYGAYDMAGNVFEWVNGWYSAGYYATSPAADPPGPASGASRVLRGGSWSSNVEDQRSAGRVVSARPSDWADDFGFRCVRDVSDP